ncbi:hypothetical protein LY13_002793 [Prauserella aidingensis]|uniref:GNAT family N-acetyltransferase n=1 Tax=Prauserella aidingensis TaxID=387890 RepID=UPI0020A4C7CB|nr:GNAT family N-acetyltransferase [Prauserella aidingensis]MCP2254029.1 hypothetical protein [Prauserella aidingensis]
MTVRSDTVVDARVCDPRVDGAPDGWSEFACTAGPHAVWEPELLRIEGWLTRNPPLLVTVHDTDGIVVALSALVCRPTRTPRYAPRRARRGPMWAEVAQPWLSGLPGVVRRPGVSGDHLRVAVRSAERALARRLGAGLAGLFYRGVGSDLLPELIGRGRIHRRTDPSAVLDNTFSSVDEWLASLSKSRRAGLRRQHRRAEADPALVVRGGPGRTDIDAAAVAGLLNDHRARFPTPAGDTRSPIAAPYVEAFVRRPDVHTLTYHDTDGRLLALNTLLDHHDVVVKQHWAALPPEEGGRQGLYFDAYVRAVRWCIAHGRPRISSGRGKLDVKTSLGFTPRDVHGVIAPRPVMGR